MRNHVRLFKFFSAEVGDPKKLLFVPKLVKPVLLGIRIKINKINKIFIISQINFNIYCSVDKR